jgi:hypothetical protein
VYLPALVLIRVCCLLATGHPATARSVEHITAIADELRGQLQIQQQVRVTIAPENNRMLSVEPVGEKGDGVASFDMVFDDTFVSSLDEEELRAAIAHELGHVWIFLHHPYLHTEPLANEIAARVVDVESLRRLYKKLWAHLGVTARTDEVLPSKSAAQ